MPKVILAGGGTGGHLFPALAIAEELKKKRPQTEVVFMGTRRGIESKLIPQAGYRLIFLDVRGFQRRLGYKNLLFFYHLLKSLMQAKRILKQENPDVVVGTGGYVSGPPLSCAKWLKIPILIQEQNSFPGVTTRRLASRADKVFLAYAESKKYFKRQDNLELVGNPIRSTFGKIDQSQARRELGLTSDRKTVLILGGSQDASAINENILKGVSSLAQQDQTALLWQTGQKDFHRIGDVISTKSQMISLHPFIQKMDCAYAASDLVISRAGALTLAEIAACGKPSILIPYPYAAADHQRHNAQVLVNAGAAEMILERDLGGTNLLNRAVELLKDGSKLERMSHNSRKLARPDALEKITTKIIEYLDKAEN
jgi:UDP-N-acetylglucosamine--N-acetylmuramyl-(pentapeptide) pyrophosphoryl-undecaprenol N-acetylglucosamine transferase